MRNPSGLLLRSPTTIYLPVGAGFSAALPLAFTNLSTPTQIITRAV